MTVFFVHFALIGMLEILIITKQTFNFVTHLILLQSGFGYAAYFEKKKTEAHIALMFWNGRGY